uniref:Uncharacterized protein n=1 Tax=Pristionchus pacificus TaxID=54126 RepID=A0A2A6B5G5_PRIPA|eukprot:PDM61119.1 hypothetical protein PRIPAC_50561 [Pristionchus pacificus]
MLGGRTPLSIFSFVSSDVSGAQKDCSSTVALLASFSWAPVTLVLREQYEAHMEAEKERPPVIIFRVRYNRVSVL